VSVAWSRWLVGVWALMAALWMVIATLMLIHAWPEPMPGEHSGLYGSADEDLASRRAMTAQSNIQADPATRRHILNFLLLAFLPPAVLLLLVWAGLRVAGLPFPSFRADPQDRRSRSG
jgi:hypothetical protein